MEVLAAEVWQPEVNLRDKSSSDLHALPVDHVPPSNKLQQKINKQIVKILLVPTFCCMVKFLDQSGNAVCSGVFSRTTRVLA